MSESIKYSLIFQVAGGVSVPLTGEIKPDAYDKFQITVPAGSDVTTNLQPDGTKLANLLVIKASAYAKTLTYKVNVVTDDPIVLDGPHVYIGQGAVAVLDTAPNKLIFHNGLAADVTIDILLGRDATP